MATVLCALIVMAASLQTLRAAQCTAGVGEPGSFLAASQSLQFMEPESESAFGYQVIVPSMVFNCHGFVTGWSALSVLSVTGLDRYITFQVWRPRGEDGFYHLVGFNAFDFSNSELEADAILYDEGAYYYFNFTRSSEAIFFQPGDVIGWYIKTAYQTLDQPLSIAYRNATDEDDTALVVDMFHTLARNQLCEVAYCPGIDTEQVAIIRNVIPYVSVDYEVLTEEDMMTPPSPTPVVQPAPLSCSSTSFSSCPSPTITTTDVLPTGTPPACNEPSCKPDDNGRVTFIITAVVAAAALVIVFVFAVCLLVLCLRSKKKCCSIKLYQDNPIYSSPDEILQYSEHLSNSVLHYPARNGELYALPDRRPSQSSGSDVFDGDCYATTYQTNGQIHVYHELSETLASHRPSIASRTSAAAFSRPSLAQFPYSVPTLSIAASFPYIEAEKRDSGFSLGSERTLPSYSESSQPSPPLRKQLFVALDDEGFHVPTADDRRVSKGADELYSKLNRSRDSRDSCNTFFEQADLFWEPPSSTRELYNQLALRKFREIQRNQISIIGSLGEGHFGTVHRGVWQVPGGKVGVAVKALKPAAPESERIKFLQEAAIMGQFLHPNVVKLHGMVTVGEPLMIVLEMMPKGDLKHFLRSFSRRSLPLPEKLSNVLLNFCRQISFGMNYFANKSFVHRDLAARNILLTDEFTCKIGDFGMARDVAEDSVYHSQGGKVPLKWTAPEALNYRKFSTASDVWSYGMLLYEIWSLGRKPFERISTNKLIQLVNAGFCQPPPSGCPRAIYQLMVNCWHPVASKRPSFAEISDYLNSPDSLLLNWSSTDRAVSPQGGELGAPLSEARNLYPDLQCTYTITDDLNRHPNYY